MSIKIFSGLLSPLKLTFNSLKVGIIGTQTQTRERSRYPQKLKRRYPWWFVKQHRVKYDESLTKQNQGFIKEFQEDELGETADAAKSEILQATKSPLITEPWPRGTRTKISQRTGLIGIKIGVIPQWTTKGEKIFTTLIQIADNHVVRYIPPEEFVEIFRKSKGFPARRRAWAGLVVGAVGTDPQNFTAEYCGLFNEAGVMPKKVLTKFMITPEAAIQPGTPLVAAHFKVGDYVDVSGVTIDRGFQGVMKRYGFDGMPASHGVTKTHRRPGCIGGGANHRVWPGKKMPGHVGNRLRTIKGLRILRINHEYNVLYVRGQAIAGPTNSFVYVHDTIFFHRKPEIQHFPTYYVDDDNPPLPTEEFVEDLHKFDSPTIKFAAKK